jgi:hypothetical protein
MMIVLYFEMLNEGRMKTTLCVCTITVGIISVCEMERDRERNAMIIFGVREAVVWWRA